MCQLSHIPSVSGPPPSAAHKDACATHKAIFPVAARPVLGGRAVSHQSRQPRLCRRRLADDTSKIYKLPIVASWRDRPGAAVSGRTQRRSTLLSAEPLTE